MYKIYKELMKNNDNDNTYKVFEISSLEDKINSIENNNLCIIDIYANWCGPCKQIAPIYAKLAEKYNYTNKILLCKENVDSNLTDKSNIYGVPTFLIYINGNFSHSIVGADINSLEKVIIEYLTSLQEKEKL
jgi:thiol-disulfide isomerase/thioredoxin